MNEIDPAGGSILGLSQRLPPSNLAAEQALLGALLANNKAYERVSEFLAPEHFADPIHGRIFQAIQRRVEAGQLADVVTLRAEFEHSGLLEEVGGPAYLAQLLSAMVGIINAGEYGRVIHDAWLRRQLIDLGEVVVNRAFGADPELDAGQQVEAAEQALFDLSKDGVAGEGGPVTFDRALTIAVEHAARAFSTPGGVSGLSTGLRDLDAKMGGLHPSDLLIVAGRPGMGKTALATKIGFGAAKSILREAREKDPNAVPRGGVAIFSLEMSADQLATRLLSEEARISGDRIRRGEIGQRDFDRFVEVSREMAAVPIFIDDTPAITISALRTRCRRLKRTRGLNLVIVDYLQLMRPAAGTRPENRVLEISMITQGLKAIAKELSVPVIALSQLSRAVESREDKRPQLSDLRESGSIEQDADVVMFVYRDDYYLAQRAPKELAFDNPDKFHEAVDKWQKDMEMAHNKAELIVAKQRHGPTGTIKLFFEAEFTRFGDLDTVHDEDQRG
ncbi:replicative DNA helicase [Roseomonas sp. PWR1]|uniref:Replicative DNA helicase n=1 Tax=Roseomonas nitratireducens TaxID=2820810 RepID=A0ABS4AUX4_9PROT|nr:replicative DNA helicase [Neoroseomonas nitratireducens]MBP0465168.1 replicative DNA helicase [Neoroseomonas nitratireducens]